MQCMIWIDLDILAVSCFKGEAYSSGITGIALFKHLPTSIPSTDGLKLVESRYACLNWG